MTVAVFRCAACDLVLYPARLRCPRCGEARWQAEPVTTGTVVACTTRPSRGLTLAEIRSDAGPILIARLPIPLAAGARVTLHAAARAAIDAEPA